MTSSPPLQKTLPSKRPGKLVSDWVMHLQSEDERKKFHDYVMAQRELFRVLRGIIQERYNTLAGTKPEDLNMPGWEYKRLYRDGQMAELEMMWKLIPDNERT